MNYLFGLFENQSLMAKKKFINGSYEKSHVINIETWNLELLLIYLNKKIVIIITIPKLILKGCGGVLYVCPLPPASLSHEWYLSFCFCSWLHLLNLCMYMYGKI